MAQPVLTNATEAELATAVSQNLYALFRTMQVVSGCEVVESHRLNYHHTPLTNPFFGECGAHVWPRRKLMQPLIRDLYPGGGLGGEWRTLCLWR
jgi:hypothetical protein